MNKKYQDVISRVSSQIADEFSIRENDFEKCALLSDTDIAEVTGQIGSEAAKNRLTMKWKLPITEEVRL